MTTQNLSFVSSVKISHGSQKAIVHFGREVPSAVTFSCVMIPPLRGYICFPHRAKLDHRRIADSSADR